MSKKQKTTMKKNKPLSKAKYTLYEEPLLLAFWDVVSEFPKGGAVLYRPNKEDIDMVEVLAYIPYMQGCDMRDYLSVLQKNEPGIVEAMNDYRVEIIRPVQRTEINATNPTIMSFRRFFSECGIIDEMAEECMDAYKVSADAVRLYLTMDFSMDVITYFGYSIDSLSDKTDTELPDGTKEMTYREFVNMKGQYTYEETNYNPEDSAEHIHEDKNVCESSEPQAAMEKAEELPHIILAIRKWLHDTDFMAFLNAITDRVKGQKETEMIVVNVYNYLDCIANGKQHNNHIILAAPSGCGKTETYRAIRDYFKEMLPDLTVYQFDMTQVTEEGFKGCNTADIVKGLPGEANGIGIVFLDEFDKKLVPSFSSNKTNVNLAVQSQILTLVEGRVVEMKLYKIDTSNTLFIAMGAFDSCRGKKSVGEKHIGFEQNSTKGKRHYTSITREDMISEGACYELIGRFSTVINYQELSYEIVDEIIDGMLKKEAESVGYKIRISDKMRQSLHQNANGKFGCRIIAGNIHERTQREYLKLLKANQKTEKNTLFIRSEEEEDGEAKLEGCC